MTSASMETTAPSSPVPATVGKEGVALTASVCARKALPGKTAESTRALQTATAAVTVLRGVVSAMQGSPARNAAN